MRSFKQWCAYALCLVCAVLLCLSIQPTTLLADPSDEKKPVEHLVVVTNTDWFKQDLESALMSEEAYDATSSDSLQEYVGLEHSDHTFVEWSDDPATLKANVSAAVTQLRGEFPETDVAVVFWMGFQEVDDAITFTHEVLKKSELEDNLKDKVKVEGSDDTYETVETDEKQYEWETETETRWKCAAERYADVVSAEGGLGQWLTDSKVSSYWVSLPPNAIKDENGVVRDGISLLGDTYTSVSDKHGQKPFSDLYGFWAKRWNQSLSGAGSVIDLWDAAADSKLYYTDNVHLLGSGYHGDNTWQQTEISSGVWVGAPTADLNRDELPDDSGNEKEFKTKKGDIEYNDSDAEAARANSYEFYSYTAESYQQLFHIVLETVQNRNTLPVSADPIPQDMYSISTAMSAYISNVLSANAKEDHDVPSAQNAGNAGAFIGYGDKDKGFAEGIIADLSETSSSVSYKALKSANLKDELAYARYGKLLSDLGVDEVGVRAPGLSFRTVSGAAMLIVFVLSLIASKIFGWFVDLLYLLNPFRFFISVPGFTPLAETVNESDASFLKAPLQAIVQSDVYQTLSHLLSSLYNMLNDWAWFIVVPVALAALVVGIFFGTGLLSGRYDRRAAGHKIASYVFKVAFLVLGVPLLGVFYTNALTYFTAQTEDVHSPAVQVVGSTFLDFGAWVENSRLAPLAGSEDAFTANSGGAANASVASLRDTVLKLNQSNHVIDPSVPLLSGGSDALKWSNNALNPTYEPSENSIKQSYSLLTSYMNSDFYYPSDWETAVGNTMAQNVQAGTYVSGRRKGGEEQDFDSEALQGENTYYNMYDSINELDDWTGRDVEENEEIFSDETKWQGFNILNNGTLTATGGQDNLSFSSVTDFDGTTFGEGTNPAKRGGLSTMSVYNYLSSKFSDEGVTMYSNSNTANIGSRYSHYAITSAGSGVTGILYFANAFVLLMLVSIIGLVYLIGALFNILKKGAQMLVAIPGAALGSMRSIAQVISVVIAMICEVLLVGFLYTLILMVISSIMSVCETVVHSISAGPSLVTVSIAGAQLEPSFAYLALTLVVSSVLLLALSYFLLEYRRFLTRCIYSVSDSLMMSLCLYKLEPKSVLDFGCIRSWFVSVYRYLIFVYRPTKEYELC